MSQTIRICFRYGNYLTSHQLEIKINQSKKAVDAIILLHCCLNVAHLSFFSGNVEGSLCTLERMQAMISDCRGSRPASSVPDYEDVIVEEAAIITFNQSVSLFTERVI